MRMRRVYVLRIWVEPDAPADDQAAMRGTLQPAEGGPPRPFSSLEQLAVLIRTGFVDPAAPTNEGV
jgi:hypothetical protein